MSGFERVFWASLTPEQIGIIEEFEYGFLAECGYRVKGCRLYEKRRKRLKNALKRNKARLIYIIYPEKDGKGVRYFYELRQKGHATIRSKAILFVMGGVSDGEEQSKE